MLSDDTPDVSEETPPEVSPESDTAPEGSSDDSSEVEAAAALASTDPAPDAPVASPSVPELLHGTVRIMNTSSQLIKISYHVSGEPFTVRIPPFGSVECAALVADSLHFKDLARAGLVQTY